jgi:hypothetical protein
MFNIPDETVARISISLKDLPAAKRSAGNFARAGQNSKLNNKMNLISTNDQKRLIFLAWQ